MNDSVAAPRVSPADQDLAGLLDRLHDEMDLERTADVEAGTELTDARELKRPERERVVVETAGGIEFDPTFAPFATRAAGYLIDSVIVAASLLPGAVLATLGSTTTLLIGSALAFAGFAIAMTWAARSLAATGRWIGNRVTGTKVVDTRTGQLLRPSEAAARTVVRHLISPILLLGFVPAFFDSQRRTFHDRVATSIVISRPRDVWTADTA